MITLREKPTEFGTEKRYVTTTLDRRIFHRMEEIDLDETVAELQKLHRKRDDQRETPINRLYRDELILRAEGRIGSDTEEPYADVPEKEMPDIEVPSLEEMKQERLDQDLIGGDNSVEDSAANDGEGNGYAILAENDLSTEGNRQGHLPKDRAHHLMDMSLSGIYYNLTFCF